MDELESRTIERGGYTVEISIYHDPISQPSDYDCYDASDIKAYERDEWTFVTVRAAVIYPHMPVPNQNKARFVQVTAPTSGGLSGIDFHFDDASRAYCYDEIGIEQADEAIAVLKQLAIPR